MMPPGGGHLKAAAPLTLRGYLVALLVALLVSAGVVGMTREHLPRVVMPDGFYYRELAAGRPSQVIKPFSTRVLHPLVVRGVAATDRRFPFLSLSLSLDRAFLVVGVLSLFGLTFGVALILQETTSSPLLLIPVMGSPFLLHLFQRYELPDLFHAALLGLFFLTVTRHRLAGLLVLFLLLMTRESTLLLVACIILVAWYQSWPRLAIETVAVSLVGVAVLAVVGTFGQPNIHQLNPLLYLSFKLLYNFSSNILGLAFWTNTYESYNPLFCSPVWTMPLPAWVPAGSVHTVGLCTPDPARVLTTLSHLLTTFGVLPTLVLAWLISLRGEGGEVLKSPSPWFPVALLYGVLAFVLGTSTGGGVDRLVGYGWPAFWIAAPILLAVYAQRRGDRRAFWGIILLHVLACWHAHILSLVGLGWLVRAGPAATTALVLLLHGGAWVLSCRLFRRAPAGEQ